MSESEILEKTKLERLYVKLFQWLQIHLEFISIKLFRMVPSKRIIEVLLKDEIEIHDLGQWYSMVALQVSLSYL